MKRLTMLCTSCTMQVDQAAIDQLHAQYYKEVARLFHEHKEGFPGYENVRLAFAEK